MKLFCAEFFQIRWIVFCRICGLCSLFLIIFPCCSPVFYASRLPVKTYVVADGLLRDTIYKIKQDSRGFLWFCTAEGVSRFDGYSFTNFTATDGLSGGNVNDFLETESGDYLFATDNGIARLNPKGLRGSVENPLFNIISPDNKQAKTIQVLFRDENGQVLVGTTDGLYRLNEKFEFEAVSLPNGQTTGKKISVTAILKDRRGLLWIGTNGNGLFRLGADGAGQQFTTADGLPGNSVASLLEDRDGKLWAGMRPATKAGLVLLDPAPGGQTPIVRRAFTAADGIPSNWIPSMISTGDGRFWIGTTVGLCQWQGAEEKSVCRTYAAENDLCDNIWSLMEDKDGNLWTGSECGAKKIARYGFMTYDERDGTGLSQTNSIFENRRGELFATVINVDVRTIYRYDGDKFRGVKPHPPAATAYLGWANNQTVQPDFFGAWLIPTAHGLFKFPAGTTFDNLSATRPENFSPAGRGSEILRLFEDLRGDLWVTTTGAGGGLWRWERKTNVWHDHTDLFDSVENRFGLSFVEDKSGNLWIGTGSDEGGGLLIRYRDGQFKVLNEDNGVPDGWFRDLYVDHAGRLWLANNKNGLLRLDDVNAEKLNFVRYSTTEGLSSTAAYCITEDVFGRIYVGGPRGVDRLSPDTGQVENFTTADGLPSSIVVIAFRDRQNNLWFGTMNGLTRYTPEPARQRQPPITLITGLRVNGEPQAVSVLGEPDLPNTELNADERQISIDFTGLASSLGEQLKYEYRLGGSEWTRTTEKTVNFADLAPGDYQFLVQAITADGVASHKPASVSFRILSPVWQRWWFILGVMAVVGLAVYVFYRARFRRLLEMERMRTRIATDLHDDIGANLTRISLLSEVANQQSTNGRGNLLTSIANIARESVASMNDIVWAISPDHDRLVDLTRRMRQHAEEIFELREIDLTFNAPTTDTDLKLSVGVRRDVLLIYKEAVNNSARHSDCTEVEIDFRCDNSILSLQISDNGIGFETDPENEGHGLRSMSNRAKALGGNLKIDSRPGRGTIVKFELVLQKTTYLGV